MNLICLCKYCHGNVHGLHLSELYLDPEEVELACVEYVSDMYAGFWDPVFSLDYDDPGDMDLGKRLISAGVFYLKGVPARWTGTTWEE